MRLADNADMAIILLILLESSVVDILLLIATLTLHLHQIPRRYIKLQLYTIVAILAHALVGRLAETICIESGL